MVHFENTEFYKTYVLLEDLVRLATVRLRIKCEFEEMKGEMGPNHYEGRNWLGFHHHGVLCMAACAFLVAERARLSPQNLLLSSSPLGYPEVPVRGGCRCF